MMSPGTTGATPTGRPAPDGADHERITADLAGYALGTLEPVDAQDVARHVEGCEACRGLLSEYDAVREAMPFGLALSPPPPGARERLLARARTPRPATDAGPSRLADRTSTSWAAAPRKRAEHRLRLLAGAALVAAAVILAVLVGRDPEPSTPPATGAETVVADLRGRGDTRALTLAPPEAGFGRTGELLLPGEGEAAGLMVRGLPVLPPDRGYQLWFQRPDGSRVSGGVFAVDASGEGVATVTVPPDLDGFARVGITEEPAGGSPGPTGPPVLTGQLPR